MAKYANPKMSLEVQRARAKREERIRLKAARREANRSESNANRSESNRLEAAAARSEASRSESNAALSEARRLNAERLDAALSEARRLNAERLEAAAAKSKPTYSPAKTIEAMRRKLPELLTAYPEGTDHRAILDRLNASLPAVVDRDAFMVVEFILSTNRLASDRSFLSALTCLMQDIHREAGNAAARKPSRGKAFSSGPKAIRYRSRSNP